MSILDTDSLAKCESMFSSFQKWQVALFLGLLFLVVSSPYIYTLVDKLFSYLHVDIATFEGLPTTQGLILHTIIFILIVRMFLK